MQDRKDTHLQKMNQSRSKLFADKIQNILITFKRLSKVIRIPVESTINYQQKNKKIR